MRVRLGFRGKHGFFGPCSNERSAPAVPELRTPPNGFTQKPPSGSSIASTRCASIPGGWSSSWRKAVSAIGCRHAFRNRGSYRADPPSASFFRASPPDGPPGPRRSYRARTACPLPPDRPIWWSRISFCTGSRTWLPFFGRRGACFARADSLPLRPSAPEPWRSFGVAGRRWMITYILSISSICTIQVMQWCEPDSAMWSWMPNGSPSLGPMFRPVFRTFAASEPAIPTPTVRPVSPPRGGGPHSFMLSRRIDRMAVCPRASSWCTDTVGSPTPGRKYRSNF